MHPREDIRVFERIGKSISARYPGEFVFVVSDGKGDELKSGVEIRDLGKMPKSKLLRIMVGWIRGIGIVNKFRPSVIHFHDPELLFLAPFWRLMGVSVVYDVHEELRKQLLGKPWIPRIMRVFLSKISILVEGLLVKFVSAISVATPVIANCYPNNMVWVIQNYPSVKEQLHNSNKVCQTQSGNFFYVGGITERRCIFEILDAVLFVSRKYCISLTLAGRFSSESLFQKAKEHPAWGFVNYIGWADRVVVADVMTKSLAGLVLCYPEKNYMEAQPTKLYEYMWGGLPVIASDFPYWRKFVDDNKGILFVNPNSSEQIALAMTYLIENEEWAHIVGRGLQEYAMLHFSWEDQEKRLYALYDSLFCKS